MAKEEGGDPKIRKILDAFASLTCQSDERFFSFNYCFRANTTDVSMWMKLVPAQLDWRSQQQQNTMGVVYSDKEIFKPA